MMRYYLDTEFDGFGGPLMSLALVAERGPGVYYVFDVPVRDAWVKSNVVPFLYSAPVGGKRWERDAAAMDIAWLLKDDPEPVIITDWPADIRYFCELIEFPMGEMAPIIGPLRFELHRVDAYPTTLPGAVQHNAWWDAMALRHLLTNVAAPAAHAQVIEGEGSRESHNPSPSDPTQKAG